MLSCRQDLEPGRPLFVQQHKDVCEELENQIEQPALRVRPELTLAAIKLLRNISFLLFRACFWRTPL